MTDSSLILLGTALIAVSFIAGLIVARKAPALPDPTPEPETSDPDEPLYLHLADWGPDYTGEGDVLHRWRWTLWLADPKWTEASTAGSPIVGVHTPLYLGNAATPMLAVMEAEDWARRHFPGRRVVVIPG